MYLYKIVIYTLLSNTNKLLLGRHSNTVSILLNRKSVVNLSVDSRFSRA